MFFKIKNNQDHKMLLELEFRHQSSCILLSTIFNHKTSRLTQLNKNSVGTTTTTQPEIKNPVDK